MGHDIVMVLSTRSRVLGPGSSAPGPRSRVLGPLSLVPGPRSRVLGPRVPCLDLPAFFHLGECATYQSAVIDQSDWPIQTVIVQRRISA